MGNPPALAEVTAAVCRMLANATGKLVGDGEAPPGAVERDGYGVVDVIPGGWQIPDMAMPGGHLTMVLQVTWVGVTRMQAQHGADWCQAAILGRVDGTGAFTRDIDAFAYAGGAVKSLAADVGVQVWQRDLDMDGGVDHEGPLYNAVRRYAVTVGPV